MTPQLLIFIALPIIALFGLVLFVCWFLEALNYVVGRLDDRRAEREWKEQQKLELERSDAWMRQNFPGW